MLQDVSLCITKDAVNTFSELVKCMIVGSIGTKSYFNQIEKKEAATQSLFLDKLRRMRASLNLEEQKREPARYKSLQKIVCTEYYKKLFEEFFIVGPDDKEIKGFEVNEIRYVRPKKLYQYPNNFSSHILYYSISIISERRETLKDFCFPAGVRVLRMPKGFKLENNVSTSEVG
jgi:hypothetical protein